MSLAHGSCVAEETKMGEEGVKGALVGEVLLKRELGEAVEVEIGVQ